MKIAILGCGPAGLMAAQGAYNAMIDAGEITTSEIAVISRRAKSDLFGAQYLHQPIPGVTEDAPRQVRYRLEGASADYRRKVYGPMWDGTVSPEDLEEEHEAWDIRATYDRLWRRWSRAINHAEINPAVIHEIIHKEKPDLVISSIPLSMLCYRGHTFGFTEIVAAGDAPDLGIRVPFACPDETVICNGLDNPAWYRLSRVFGHTTVEWPISVGRVPIRAATVQKPTYHACDCFPDVFKVGRYGSWQKGVLSHTAYYNTYNKIKEMLGATEEATA